MQIIYDDLFEFSEVVVRCTDTANKGKCQWCPFYDRCQIDKKEDRHIQCGELRESKAVLESEVQHEYNSN